MEHDAELVATAVAPRAGVVARLWGVVATILSVLYTAILLIPAALVARVKQGHYVSPVMRLWAWLIFHTCAVTAEVEGLEHLRGVDSFILVSNHQSLFDIIAIVHLTPRAIRFVAKQELRRVPLLGYVLAHSGNVLIDRGRGGRSIRHALAATRAGYSTALFAEGRRYSDNRVHDFSDGAAWLAIATGRPCVPLAISGTVAMMPRGAWFARAGVRIRLAFGAPIATADLRSSDRAQLTMQLETSVRDLFRIEV
ncbi:MAG: lysophospholipid acyltransferase family protein [Candidatus Binataceae bacterium]